MTKKEQAGQDVVTGPRASKPATPKSAKTVRAKPSRAATGASATLDDDSGTPAAVAKRARTRPNTQDAPAGASRAMTRHPVYVVALGASAGGLEALRPLIAELRSTGQNTYIVAQHMSPQHTSLLTDLLSRDAQIPVTTAKDGDVLKTDHVYVTPPNRDVTVRDGRIVLVKPANEIGPKPSVDLLLHSVAEYAHDNAVAVILSGTGSDGAHGCRAVKAEGGLVIVQKLDEAKHDGMPMAAVRSGSVDLQLSVAEISHHLNTLSDAPPARILKDQPEGPPNAAKLRDVLDLVFKATQIDFTQYKEATLGRQVERRIAALRLDSLEDYLTHVRSHPTELSTLQKSFLISVTSFFRDPGPFQSLAGVISNLAQTKRPRESIRVWVPGCATGEEAYSIAIMLVETLGSRLNDYDVRVFATDIDLAATDVARAGLYPEASLEGMSPHLRERYFHQEGRFYRISKLIREMCVFARQDVVRDPPFLRMDLISCRNVLIYFKQGLQEDLFNKFHYALNMGGYLLLGKSESTSGATNLFSTVDGKNKLYRRKAVQTPHPVRIGGQLTFSSTINAGSPGRSHGSGQLPARLDVMRDVLLREYAPASILVSQAFEPLHFFGNARRYMALPEGAADFSILSLCIPAIRTELRTLLHRLGQEGLPETVGHPMVINLEGKSVHVRMVLRQLWIEDGTGERGIMICFEEHSGPDQEEINALLGQASGSDGAMARQLVEVQQELAGTREHLQAVIEELETSNEELQSLNEELQASSEELQSSNEELETTNEELQATNEELTTLNDELQAKSAELTELNDTLTNIQNSVQIALVVVDRQGRVNRFNPLAVRIFGLLPDDLGQHLVGVPCNLDLPNLRDQLERAIDQGETVTERASRDDVHYLMQIAPYRDSSGHRTGAVVSFTNVTALRKEEVLRLQTEERMRFITDSLREVVWMSDPLFDRLLYVSANFEDLWGRPIESVLEQPRSMLEWVHPDDRPHLEHHILHHAKECWDFEYRIVRPDGVERWVKERGQCVLAESGTCKFLVSSTSDVTDLVHARLEQQRTAQRFRSVFSNTAVGMAVVDTSGKIQEANPAFAHMLDYEPEELVGVHFRDITVEEDRAGDLALFAELQAGTRESYSLDKRYLTREGHIRWGRLTVSMTRHEEPVGNLVVAVIQDITQSKLQQATIFQQANFDALTNLPNRNLTLDRLQEQMRLSDRSGLATYALFVDLDGFKPVNDLLGHKVGDLVLKEIASRFSGLVRSTDTVGRFGGDEFVVVLGQIEDVVALERVIHDLLEAARQPMPEIRKGLQLSASIGVARYPGDGDSPTLLVQHADTAMYTAKKGGRNGFRYFAPHMNDEAQRRAQIRREIALALEDGQFELHLQPIWSTETGRPRSAEALIRWNHPLRGMVPPGDFIQLTEETGQILEIGQWVLNRAAELVEGWGNRWGKDFRLAVNVSAEQFATRALMEQMQAQAKALPHLIIEITESVLIENNELVIETLNQVRELGGKTALDDFGMGYSSLAYLQKLPVDEIKIDKSFVDDLLNNPQGKPLVEAIVGIANAIGADIVAEGVELATQARYLSEFPRMHLQGWYVARPMPVDKFEAWMDKPPKPTRPKAKTKS